MFVEAEQDLVMNVFRLGDRRINVLMTPRPEIVWLDLNASPSEMQRQSPLLPLRVSWLAMGALTTCSASCAPEDS